jgi:hypothetical protein
MLWPTIMACLTALVILMNTGAEQASVGEQTVSVSRIQFFGRTKGAKSVSFIWHSLKA